MHLCIQTQRLLKSPLMGIDKTHLTSGSGTRPPDDPLPGVAAGRSFELEADVSELQVQVGLTNIFNAGRYALSCKLNTFHWDCASG